MLEDYYRALRERHTCRECEIAVTKSIYNATSRCEWQLIMKSDRDAYDKYWRSDISAKLARHVDRISIALTEECKTNRGRVKSVHVHERIRLSSLALPDRKRRVTFLRKVSLMPFFFCRRGIREMRESVFLIGWKFV